MAKQAASSHTEQEWHVSLETDGKARVYVVEGTGAPAGDWLSLPVVEVDAERGVIVRHYEVMEPRVGYSSSIDLDEPGLIKILEEARAPRGGGSDQVTGDSAEPPPDCRNVSVDASEAIRIAAMSQFPGGLEPSVDPLNLILVRHRGKCKWLIRVTLAMDNDGRRTFAGALIDAESGRFESLGVRESHVRGAGSWPATPN